MVQISLVLNIEAFYAQFTYFFFFFFFYCLSGLDVGYHHGNTDFIGGCSEELSGGVRREKNRCLRFFNQDIRFRLLHPME